MYAEHHSISIVKSSATARTYYSPILTGRLLAVRYSTAGATMKTTDTVLVRNETTNELFSTKILSAAGSWRQRLPLTTSTGGVIGYAAGEFHAERAKISINASTGAGTLILTVG